MSTAEHSSITLDGQAQQLLDLARRAGADEVEVYGTSGTSVGAKVERGDLGQVHADEGSSLGLRVIVDGRLGFASTNQLDERSLAAAATDAVAIARLSPPDEANVLPDPTPIDPGRLLGHRVDPALASISVAEVVERAQEIARKASAVDPRVSVDQSSFSVVSARSLVLSSRGVSVTDSDAALTMSLMGLAVDGDQTGGMDYRGAVVRDAVEVEAELTRIATEVGRSCVQNLGAKAGESYQGPVLFAPAALAQTLLGPLLGGVSAIAVQRGRSPLAGKLGENVAGGIRVYDDPSDRSSAGARAFDREGRAAQRFEIVQGGRLSGFLHNAYSAAVDGVVSTGHAQGGTRGVPGLGAHAIVMAADGEGPADEAAMIRELGRGLYVQRFSGSVDPASGDFSGTAKSARWVEGGEVVRSVQEVMLSGNAFALLRDAVRLSKASERVGGSSRIPWALVDRVSVTAG